MQAKTSYAVVFGQLCCTLSALIADPANADYAAVFGGPAYDEATGNGFQFPITPTSTTVYRRSAVNNSGIASGSANKYSVGASQGYRAFQWTSTATQPVELSRPDIFGEGFALVFAYAINDAGTAVGSAYERSRGERPVRWDSLGNATELGSIDVRPGGNFTYGQALAINNTGTAVGYSDRWLGSDFIDRAVRWDAAGSSPTELGELPHGSSRLPQSRALAINDSGIAVGWAEKLTASGSSRGHRAVRWDSVGTAATELGPVGTARSGSFFESEVYDINRSGTAVGWSSRCTEVFCGGTVAARWDESGTAATELESLGNPSLAVAINDTGTAVGVSGFRAVRWDASGTAATVLGHLGSSDNSAAYDINSIDIAVGRTAKVVDGNLIGYRAVAWREDAVAIDLNVLIDPDSGWLLSSAHSISDTNWITGHGSFDPDGPGGFAPYDRYFLLQLPPVPEPSAITQIVLGFFVAIQLRGRRRQVATF